MIAAKVPVPLEFKSQVLQNYRSDVYELSRTLFSTNFQSVASIFDTRHTNTSDNVPTSFSILSDPENMCIAVGILLITCIEVEIYVLSFLLPVNGRHL